MVKIIGFPGRYIQGPDALAVLPALLAEFGATRPVIVWDEIVRAAVGDTLTTMLRQAGVEAKILGFGGECTSAEIARVARQVDPSREEVVIAVGGGKTIDTAKGVSKALGMRLFVVPTIASNDSPTSRLIVLYDDEHRVAGVEMLTRNPDVVLVDTSIIARAPARFFAAGLGDALSKKFEASQVHLAGGRNFFGTPSLPTARLLAEQCYSTIRAHGLQAIERIRTHASPDEDVERATEAAVLLSGLGFESGGLSLAHALTRGFTAHPGMAAMLHGELVAFGSIVQLIAEDRPGAEIAEHAVFCRSLGLPVTLAALGGADAKEREVGSMAEATMAAPYIGNLRPAADAARIAECIMRADSLGRTLA